MAAYVWRASVSCRAGRVNLRGCSVALFRLFGRKRWERAGFELYTASVRAARDPYFYLELNVPDTMDGRFDMIGVFVFLVINRLQSAESSGPDLAQAVFDA